jgi:two-component system, OmpR family, sensor histidine kinase KdpD
MIAKDIVTASRPSPRAGIFQRSGGDPDGTGLPQWSRALLRAVTHELRSPLTVIHAYSSVVLQRKTRISLDEVKDIMRRIDRSAELAQVIVGDLETLVKQEAATVRPVTMEVRSFIVDHADDLQALAPGRNLQIELYPEALLLFADPHRLRQVLNNLVENAHKYSRPGGGITIRVGCARDSVLIAVQDEGPGVPPGEIEQVFEPFYRGSHQGEANGSGLGLAICKSLVEAQGGGLRAAPSPRGGFQILLTLPAAA